MSKTWKTFNFSPLSLFDVRGKTGEGLAAFLRDVFTQKLGSSDGGALYNKCSTYAELYAITRTIENRERARFAVGLCYKIVAPLSYGDLMNGMGLVATLPALEEEQKKIKRIVGAVLDRFAPLLAKAKTAQEALEFGDAGRVTSTTTSDASSSSSSSSSGTRTDLFKAGTASGVTGTPSGKTETSDSGSAEASTETSTNTNSAQSMGFLGQVEALREFQNGGLEAVEESVINAIFEAVFEPIEQPEDKLYFGDLSVKKWG